jgi:hypothetical protein
MEDNVVTDNRPLCYSANHKQRFFNRQAIYYLGGGGILETFYGNRTHDYISILTF